MQKTVCMKTPSYCAIVVLAMLGAGCGGRSLPEGATSEVRVVLEACEPRHGDAKRECYERRLLDELEGGGVAAALTMLGALGAADEDVERDGHVYTHAIGLEAYAPEAPLAEVFVQCTTLYQSGCYHGVIQAHFVAEGTADSATVRELCEPYQSDPADRWTLFQCLHGLGHGLMPLYNHDLPRTLRDCDFLTSSWNRESCYGGAFMENVVNATNPHHLAAGRDEMETEGEGGERDPQTDEHDHTAIAVTDGVEPFEALRADDPHYPCSILEDRYLTACYMMQTSAMLWHNGGDVGDAASSCAEAKENWRATCFQSLGRDISSRTLQDPESSLRSCGKSPEAYREWCYVGLVKNFVDLTATTDAGFAFCARVEEWAKDRCHEAMGEEIGVLHGTAPARRSACAVSETGALERACLRGARVRVD